MNGDPPTPAPTRPALLQQCAQVWHYTRTHPAAQTWRYLSSKDAPFVVQFAKYALCGGLAFLTHQLIWLLFSWKILPALDGMGLTDQLRARNHAINNSIAFLASNFVAYLTNVRWVFTTGRHHRTVEFLLFTLVNVVSFVAGLLAGPFLIHQFGISSILAQVSLVVTCTLVNFVCRKFVVFKR